MLTKPNLFNVLLLSTAFASALPAFSGPLVDRATEIEAMLAANDTAGALNSATALLAMVWDMPPEIGIRESLLVTQPASGFGIYNPRKDEKYKVGEPVYIYAEPDSFGYGTPDEGLFSIGFVVDLTVMTEMGEVLGTMPGLTEVDLTSRYQNREFQTNITYNLNGITAGRYILQTTLRDKNSTKTGVFENTIEIVE